MKPIEHPVSPRTRTARPPGTARGQDGRLDDEFNSLSGLFRARLQSERMHFASLSAALAHAEESPGKIFEDVNFRAHRLKGTAAIFEFKDIAAAAHALEYAAKAAIATRAPNSDAAVWSALVALVSLLADFETDAPVLPGFAAVAV